MRFDPNEDQTTFLSVLEQMMESAGRGWKTSPEWAPLRLVGDASTR